MSISLHWETGIARFAIQQETFESGGRRTLRAFWRSWLLDVYEGG